MTTSHVRVDRIDDEPHTERGRLAYESTLRFLESVAARRTWHAGTPAPDQGPLLVRDVMTRSVVTAHEDATFKQIVATLARNRISAVPVIDAERRVVGVVSEADLLAHVAHTGPPLPRGHALSARRERIAKIYGLTAARLMTTPPVVVGPETAITSAAWLAARRRVKRLPVVDQQGVLQGIVARADLLRTFLRTDDEIRADVVENVVRGTFILDPGCVAVRVVDGVVSLIGRVPTRAMRTALIATVRGVVGVVDVDADALGCEPDPVRG